MGGVGRETGQVEILRFDDGFAALELDRLAPDFHADVDRTAGVLQGKRAQRHGGEQGKGQDQPGKGADAEEEGPARAPG